MTHATRAKHYRRLAAFIEKRGPEKFNQKHYFCGTAACIAGSGALMLRYKPSGQLAVPEEGGVISPLEMTRQYLGLGTYDAFCLFQRYAPWQTSEQAVAELLRRARAEERLARKEK